MASPTPLWQYIIGQNDRRQFTRECVMRGHLFLSSPYYFRFSCAFQFGFWNYAAKWHVVRCLGGYGQL